MAVSEKPLFWYDRPESLEALWRGPSLVNFPWQEPPERPPSRRVEKCDRNEVAFGDLSSFQSCGSPQRLE
jgi:hypothetical protein